MKPQDFMEALGGVSQEKLDALAEWQEALTHITGGTSAQEKRITQTAAEPVSAQRRRGTVKQKKKAPAVRLLPWTAGIGAVIAACAVIAASIGKDVIGQEKQMQTGSNAGISAAEQTAEAARHEPVEMIERLCVIGGSDHVMMKVPPEGAVQVLRSTADADACCQYTDEKAVKDEDFDFRTILTEDVFAAYDVLYFALKDEQIPLYFYTYDFAGGCIAADGMTLKLNFHALMHDPEHLPKHILRSYEPDWNTYCFYTVPKGSLPDLNAIEVNVEEYPIGEIPDEILNDYEAKGDALQKHLETTQEYLDYVNSVPKQLFITWENDAPVPPEDCTEEQETEPETLPEPVAAGNWKYYHGNDIPLPDGKTVQIIRTLDEAQAYVTGSGQQTERLERFLSAEWMEQETELTDGTVSGPHDILFVGIPAGEMPEGTVSWGLHGGTVTPSGRLHLDFTVLRLAEGTEQTIPESKRYAPEENYYFFIAVPDNSLPEITSYSISFSQFMGTEYQEQAPETLLSEDAYHTWLQDLPAFKNWLASTVLCKSIEWTEDGQQTVVPLRTWTALRQEPTVPEGKVDCVPSFDSDTISLSLPLHEKSEAAAITDLSIGRDGVLSLTLHEYCGQRGMNREEYGASAEFVLYVPKGSLPEITGLHFDRVEYEDKWNSEEADDSIGFSKNAAGKLISVQLAE